jgi:tetratricopeptide (TPR) repeat protein
MDPEKDPTERARRKQLDEAAQAETRENTFQVARNTTGDALRPLFGIPAPPDPDAARLRILARIQRAEGALMEQDYGEALRILDDVLTAQPDNAEALWLRAAAHADCENFGPAVRDAEAALRLDPVGAWPRCAAEVKKRLPLWRTLARK